MTIYLSKSDGWNNNNKLKNSSFVLLPVDSFSPTNAIYDSRIYVESFYVFLIHWKSVLRNIGIHSKSVSTKEKKWF